MERNGKSKLYTGQYFYIHGIELIDRIGKKVWGNNRWTNTTKVFKLKLWELYFTTSLQYHLHFVIMTSSFVYRP